MKNKIVQTCLLLFIPLSVLSQWSVHHEKYWIYRERLNNYMVSDQCQGCGIPALSRDVKTLGSSVENGSLHLADEGWQIGYWIGTLAMEHKMLSDAGADLAQTEKDLFYAIEALNRLEYEAEGSWGCTKSLNGFMIRDDMPLEFPQNVVNNELINDLLNKSWVPPPDGWRSTCIASAYTDYLNPGGEISQDHYTGIFIGLTLVKALVPFSAYYDDGSGAVQFMDGSTSFVGAVMGISNRIITWLSGHAWILWNPCENRCVHGVGNPRNPDNYLVINAAMCNKCAGGATLSLHLDDGLTYCNTCNLITDNCCFEGGAITLPQIVGFTKVNAYIQGTLPALMQHSNSVDNTLRRVSWNVALIAGDLIPVTLAALGNIWDFHKISGIGFTIIVAKSTKGVAKKLVKRGEDDNWEHLILLHRLIYGTETLNDGSIITIPQSYYECLLNASPCRGFNGGSLSGNNPEWGCMDRLAGQRDCSDNGAASNGINYMFYFNLYSLVFSPVSASNFGPLDIKDLAPVNVVKLPGNNHVEYDLKNFMASKNITAHDYTVNSAPSKGQGRVTFVAGEKITLGPGFSTINGAKFHGYIDQTINAMSCSTNIISDCSSYFKTSIASTLPVEDDDMDTLWSMNNTLEPEVSEGYSDDKKIKDQNIQIYPNPTTGTFTLSLPTENTITVYILDVLGNLIYQRQTAGSANQQIDLSNHPKGIYLVKVVTDSELFVEKIVYQ